VKFITKNQNLKFNDLILSLYHIFLFCRKIFSIKKPLNLGLGQVILIPDK